MLYALGPARRAGILVSSVTLLLAALAGCSSSDLTDPGSTSEAVDRPLLDTTRRLPSSSGFIVSPSAATGPEDKSIHFAAYTLSSTGDSVAVTVDWSASGGTISSSGDFTAAATGTYTVIGKTRGRWKKADTSSVVIVAPQTVGMVSLTVSPASVSLSPGSKSAFAATAVLPDSSTTPDSVTWTARGGSIDASGNYTAGNTAGTFWVAAVDPSTGLTDTSAVTITATAAPPAPTLAGITLSPASASVQTGGTKAFSATGHMSDGSTASVPVTFTATGGTITAGGTYTAGSTAGSYRVIAIDTSGTFADTAAVTVTAPAPTLVAVVLTPTSASLQTGGMQQFSPSGRMSDGSTAAVSVSYAATGGTVSSSGLYTAGQTAGSYRVIATQSGGTLADTAAVTVTAPPPPPSSTDCQGVDIAAGASIQSAVNANGTGVTFCISAGTYPQQTIQPKDGQRFIGARDATGARLTLLDGQGATQYAFTGSARNVVIEGLRVCNYTPALSNGAIFGYNGTGWQILDNEICNNKPGAGTDVYTGWVIRGNWIHHNGQLGITGQANSLGAVVDSNEIAYNNIGSVTDPNCCAGGMKVVLATNLTIRGNWVHHNTGHGLWCDFCYSGTQYLGNRVEDNTFVGIYHEASDAALIAGNTVLRNGSSNRGGIWVDNSGGVEVRNNVVDGATSGIMGRQVSRSDTQRQLTNLWVHDNQVTLEGSEYTGVVQYVGDNSYFTSKGNRFSSNVYVLGGSTPFAWNNTRLTLTQWNAAGQD
jgi:parallel beta-helix repeat protein